MRFNRQIFVRVLLVSFTLGISSIACLAHQRVTIKSSSGAVLMAYESGLRSVTISAGKSGLLNFGSGDVELAVVLSGAVDMWPDSMPRRTPALFAGSVKGTPGALERRYCELVWNAEAGDGRTFLHLVFYKQMRGAEDPINLGSFSFTRQQVPELRRFARFLFSAVLPHNT
jgi:hypothetical protein